LACLLAAVLAKSCQLLTFQTMFGILRAGRFAVAPAAAGLAGFAGVSASQEKHKQLQCAESIDKNKRNSSFRSASTASEKLSVDKTLLFSAYWKRYGGKKKVEMPQEEVNALLQDVGLKCADLNKRIFVCMDTDRGGTVDFKEMKKFCSMLACGSADQKATFMFNACDMSQAGEINAEEMRTVIKEMMLLCVALYPAFSMINTEKDAELMAHLDNNAVAQIETNRIVYDMFMSAGRAGVGKINLKEFLYWYKRGGKTVNEFRNLFPIFDILVATAE